MSEYGAIAVEPADPSAGLRHEISPGVQAEMTTRLWVGLDSERPPVFSASVGPLTAPAREIGYGLIKALIQLKDLPLVRGQIEGHDSRQGAVRRSYRAVRSSLAAGLVLPERRPSTDSRSQWPTVAPAFEASRQVIQFAGGRDPIRLICHVFAPRQDRIAERLLNEFLDRFNATTGESSLCDIESRLCLIGRSSLNLGRRHYWEIVIGPLEAMADIGLPLTEGPDVADTQESPTKVKAQSAMSARSNPTSEKIEVGASLLGQEAVAEIDLRSRADWSFMAAEIAEALEGGIELDDTFVETLAKRRLQYADRALRAESPGPTLESSRRIAREVVELHRLVLKVKDGAA